MIIKAFSQHNVLFISHNLLTEYVLASTVMVKKLLYMYVIEIILLLTVFVKAKSQQSLGEFLACDFFIVFFVMFLIIFSLFLVLRSFFCRKNSIE